MPYYVYRVRPFAQLDKLAEFGVFAEASRHAKALRLQDAQSPVEAGKVKVMFADDETQAEDLLCRVSDPGPSGDD